MEMTLASWLSVLEMLLSFRNSSWVVCLHWDGAHLSHAMFGQEAEEWVEMEDLETGGVRSVSEEHSDRMRG